MKKITYKSKIYYYGIIVLLVIISLWNVLSLAYTGGPHQLVIAITTSLTLGIVITKNERTQIALKIYSGIFLILSSLLFIIGPLLNIFGKYLLNEDILASKLTTMYWALLPLSIGLLVYHGSNHYIELKDTYSKVELEDHLIEKD
ncbi:MAG: hypothetical protein ACI8YQ_000285 [Polaribacter sp.]|jgi:hypothetical protein